jgi:hypothetical protein
MNACVPIDGRVQSDHRCAHLPYDFNERRLQLLNVPGLDQLATEYWGKPTALAADGGPYRYNSPFVRLRQSVEIEVKIAPLIYSYLQDEASLIRAATYLAHALVLILAFVVFLMRQQVGALILSPISLLVGLLRVLGKAGKAAHDKV